MDDPWNSSGAPERPSSRGGKGKLAAQIGMVFGGAALLGGLAYGIYSIVIDAKPAKKQVVQLTLIAPPAPPPPPPPEQKPPEPEPEQDEVKIPEPQDQPKEADEAPPSQDLGVDQAGTGPGDGFGLAGRPGGRDITETGAGTIGGGSGRSQFAWFTGKVQDQLQDYIYEYLQKQRYKAEYSGAMRVWVAADGRIERFEWVNKAGEQEVDRVLKTAMGEAPRLRVTPPADLPQPVRLWLKSRG